MSTMGALSRVAFALALGVAACGIDAIGTALPGDPTAPPPPPASDADGGGGPGDGAPSPPETGDASFPVGPPGCACGLTATAGWTEVAYAGDRASACAGDLTAIDLVANPSAPPSACACGACVPGAIPSCNQNSFSSDFDANAVTPTCDSHGLSHPSNNGMCTAVTGTYQQHGRAVPPAPSGAGTCTAPGVAAAGPLADDVRVCAPTGSSCACDPGLAPGYLTCLRAAGDVPCPAGLANRHVVASQARVTCADCGCTLAAKCHGSLTFYSDPACAASLFTINDTSCGPEGGGTYGSLKWQGTTETACTLGASSPTAALDAATASTICCP
jgi:hypothetical protein